uniref:Fibrinogen C-terminal domain-containing protein n=1 Tax=Macrostomum lignano TaxID=282301 RepID=A0A1I8FPN6_9PLAT
QREQQQQQQQQQTQQQRQSKSQGTIRSWCHASIADSGSCGLGRCYSCCHLVSQLVQMLLLPCCRPGQTSSWRGGAAGGVGGEFGSVFDDGPTVGGSPPCEPLHEVLLLKLQEDRVGEAKGERRDVPDRLSDGCWRPGPSWGVTYLVLDASSAFSRIPELSRTPTSKFTLRDSNKYFVCAKVTEEPTKVATLCTAIGETAYTVLRNLCQPDKVSERQPLLHCNFGTALEERLRDQAVFGLRNDAIAQKLPGISKLTYALMVATVSSMEAAQRYASEIAPEHWRRAQAISKDVGSGQTRKHERPQLLTRCLASPPPTPAAAVRQLRWPSRSTKLQIPRCKCHALREDRRHQNVCRSGQVKQLDSAVSCVDAGSDSTSAAGSTRTSQPGLSSGDLDRPDPLTVTLVSARTGRRCWVTTNGVHLFVTNILITGKNSGAAQTEPDQSCWQRSKEAGLRLNRSKCPVLSREYSRRKYSRRSTSVDLRLGLSNRRAWVLKAVCQTRSQAVQNAHGKKTLASCAPSSAKMSRSLHLTRPKVHFFFYLFFGRARASGPWHRASDGARLPEEVHTATQFFENCPLGSGLGHPEAQRICVMSGRGRRSARWAALRSQLLYCSTTPISAGPADAIARQQTVTGSSRRQRSMHSPKTDQGRFAETGDLQRPTPGRLFRTETWRPAPGPGDGIVKPAAGSPPGGTPSEPGHEPGVSSGRKPLAKVVPNMRQIMPRLPGRKLRPLDATAAADIAPGRSDTHCAIQCAAAGRSACSATAFVSGSRSAFSLLPGMRLCRDCSWKPRVSNPLKGAGPSNENDSATRSTVGWSAKNPRTDWKHAQAPESGSCHLVRMCCTSASTPASPWENASTNYTMTFDKYLSGSSNTTSDSLFYHKGMQFSTMDRDNDQHSSVFCFFGGNGGCILHTCRCRANLELAGAADVSNYRLYYGIKQARTLFCSSNNLLRPHLPLINDCRCSFILPTQPRSSLHLFSVAEPRQVMEEQNRRSFGRRRRNRTIFSERPIGRSWSDCSPDHYPDVNHQGAAGGQEFSWREERVEA